MGRVKDEWMEVEERGWVAPDKYVCINCVSDEFLASVVKANLSYHTCSYCGECSSVQIAAKVECIMPYVAGAFFQYYSEPSAAGLPRDSGEWVCEESITDTMDAMLSFGWDCNDELFEDVCKAFINDAWIECADGWWLGIHEHERRRYAWEHFVYNTKHKTRYFFHNKGDIQEGESYEPITLLTIIGSDIEKFGLLKELNEGDIIYRARTCKEDDNFNSLEELGPPPEDHASAGRMNPAGISYGYFALSKGTAILEIVPSPPEILSVGEFRLKSNLLAVDLTSLPNLPSIFDIDRKQDCHALMFLRSFVASITKPVIKEGREHVDYVPTQIVSEYIAQMLTIHEGRHVDAILYPSAVNPGGTNIVLFPPREVLEKWENVIELISTERLAFNTWKDFRLYIK